MHSRIRQNFVIVVIFSARQTATERVNVRVVGSLKKYAESFTSETNVRTDEYSQRWFKL